MRTILICTVGTSLFESNLKRLDERINIEKVENEKSILLNIKNAFENKRWDELAELMQNKDPKDRICGAEINTIEESLSKKWFDLQRLFFLVSDTEDGKNTGIFLKKYYLKRKDLNLKDRDIEYIVIEDLQDKDPKKFKLNGLRNLVREIGKIVRNFGKDNIAIDATGGYKAQIAIAVIIGQALDIPVYYKHERFSEIIDFVPLPITLDYDLLGKYSYIFNDFEKNDIIKDDIDFLDEETMEKLQLFFEKIDEDGQNYIALNPVGYLYLESFRLRYPKAVNLVELEDNLREKPSFRDDHYPTGFMDFVNKVYKENKWIKSCKSLPYNKQRSINGISFYVYDDGVEKKLVGTFQDGNNFGGRFRIILSNESAENMNWAADFLNSKYR